MVRPQFITGTRRHGYVTTSLVAELISSPTIMRRFRKSKLPVDVSALDPTPPAELVQSLRSGRNSRTLAVSSTAIALSIGSTFHDPPETTGNGAAIRGGYTGWQTAYGTARMAVEIAKESSDAFPPLKAVVGAVSVLIGNYDVSAWLL